MGLAISVGVLADLLKNDPEGAEWLKEKFQQVNEVLRENDLPEHREPEKLSKLTSRNKSSGFPYSFLHYLRRVAAYSFRDQNWKAVPFPESEDPVEDEVLDSEMCMFESHLLCHSDCEGFYLPLDFSEVIFDDDSKNRIPGGMLGSSYQLMKELLQIASSLEIKLENGELPDREVDKINQLDDEESGLYREKIVWLTLFEAARLSIEHQTAIVFQ